MSRTSTTSRRDFLRNLAFSPKTVAHEQSVLICVFLRGGADTLNMLIPYGDDIYYSTRPTIAIPAPGKAKKNNEASLRLDDFYSLHPRLNPILPIYNKNRLAFIQSVGSDNPSGSHFEAQDQIEHGLAYGQSLGGGWLGRFLQSENSHQQSPLCAVCIGPHVDESLRGAPSASALRSVDEMQLHTPANEDVHIMKTLSSMYGADGTMLSRSGLDTLEMVKKLSAMRGIKYQPANGAEYPAGEFGDGLRELARLVKAKVGLRVACIDFGGWDSHFFQGGAEGIQADNINVLAKGLAAFDLDTANLASPVTTLVMTEFGRRTYENSSMGTDHGRGSAMMVMGGHIHGGTIYGSFPGLKEQETDVFGPSGIKVDIDYRSVFCEALQTLSNSPNLHKIFADFQPQRLGFTKSRDVVRT